MNNSLFDNGNFDKTFDRHFTNVEKTIKRTWTFMIIVWVVGAIVSLAALGGVAYVAWHFISKAW